MFANGWHPSVVPLLLQMNKISQNDLETAPLAASVAIGSTAGSAELVPYEDPETFKEAYADLNVRKDQLKPQVDPTIQEKYVGWVGGRAGERSEPGTHTPTHPPTRRLTHSPTRLSTAPHPSPHPPTWRLPLCTRPPTGGGLLSTPNPHTCARPSPRYLTDAEFVAVFDMTPGEFEAAPSWKKMTLKKNKGLF